SNRNYILSCSGHCLVSYSKTRKRRNHGLRTRIAVFSYVYGDFSAFDAMYQDSIKQSVVQYCFIGVLFMTGLSVLMVCNLCEKIAPHVVVRGNWDDLVVRGAR